MPWNIGDFILWHGYKESDEVYWNTEIGKGRPAWNVQDATMVTKHLGFNIDIACGGIDNLVRHHDYTIAVVEGFSGEEFAHYWYHSAHLFVNGKKMSKSRGNFYYPTDLIKMGYKKEHIRFFLIYGHYRERLNFTFKKLQRTSRKLDTFRNMVNNLKKTKATESSKKARKLVVAIVTSFEKNINKDLNVKSAFEDIFKVASKLNNLRNQAKLSSKDARIALSNLKRIDSVLQIIFN